MDKRDLLLAIIHNVKRSKQLKEEWLSLKEKLREVQSGDYRIGDVLVRVRETGRGSVEAEIIQLPVEMETY